NAIKENTIISSSKEKTIKENTIISSSKENAIKDNTIISSSKENAIKENTIISSSKEKTIKENTIISSSKENAIKENTIISSSKENTIKDNTINSSPETPLTEDEKINIKYCQEKTCKFLFPYYHPEQETRANIHARLYTQLARTLNRTLVISNVGNSKIRACSRYPFDFYYDLKAFQKDYPDIRFLTQDKFLEWTKERKIRPITQHSQVIQDNFNKSFKSQKKKAMGIKESAKLGNKRRKTYCTDLFNLNITNYKQIHTGIGEFDREAMLKLATNTLKTPSITGEYEVIMILNTSPAEIFPNVTKVIPYSPYILEESKKIIKKLKSHIAVHWRMEQAIEILGLNGSIANSSDHIKIDTWISMDAFSQIRDDPKYESEFNGAGIHGILDKL
ncbi:18191_t:CDS:2, partial [Racocetra fulgida]